MSGHRKKSKRRKMTEVSLGGTLAAVFAAPTRGLAPYVAPMILPMTTSLAEHLLSELSRKNVVIVEAALQAAELDPEEFYGILTGDPAMMALTQQILSAASVTGNEDKLRILGALLGGVAASRGQTLDETAFIVAALRDIEEPHTVILDVLHRPAPDEAEQKLVTANTLSGAVKFHAERTENELMAWAPGAWLPEQVQDEVPLPAEFIPICLSVLARHGLAQTVATLGGGQRFQITNFGQRMLEAMTHAAGTGIPPER